MSKQCPTCGLVNPLPALRCDCGYNFETGKIDVIGQELESTTFRDAVLAFGTIFALFILLCLIAGIAYAIEGTGGAQEWEAYLIAASFLGSMTGYAVGWFHRLWGGTIITLSGLLISLPFILIQSNYGILLFGLPMLGTGVLYLLLYGVEESKRRVE